MAKKAKPKRDNDALKTQILQFIATYMPRGAEDVRWDGLDGLNGEVGFSILWRPRGWAMRVDLTYRERWGHIQLTWGCTTYDVTMAVAFLALATEVTQFAARLEVALYDMLKHPPLVQSNKPKQPAPR